MNRTKTTSTTRRRSLRHAALALVALVALVAASCTADPLDGPDTPNAAGTNPDDVLTFAVAPRPGFTEAAATRATDTKAALIEQEIAGQARNDRGESTAPATRAELADDATRWEQGDILWLTVFFYYDKVNGVTADIDYTSALKYDGGEWRYLTVAEVADLNTGNIPNFSRLVRWPRGWKDWVDPGMFIYAAYAGSGKPGADGTITITPKGEIPTTPLIAARSGICSPDVQPVPLKFMYESISRVRIPAGCKVELTNAEYRSTIGFSLEGSHVKREQITEIPAQLKDTDVFLVLGSGGDPTAKLTRDNVSCTFTFPHVTNEYGVPTRNGASYTLTFYTSGTETPVADYDLTIADEAGLRAFAQAVNAGDRLPNGKPAAEARVLQTANIHLTQGEWVPIGTGLDNPFRGAYNGNGNEISGLTITTATQPDARKNSYAGLFGRAEGAVLTGIKLRGVGINITQVGDVYLYVGSVAGTIVNSTLSLCTADGTVNTDGGNEDVHAGGIAGYNENSTISRCRADVETKAAVTKGGGNAYAGGIAGYNESFSFILSCESGDRAVTAEGRIHANAGGIAGYNESDGFIAFCRTGANTVTARNANLRNYAGGLVGFNRDVSNLYSCYSRATATATGTGEKRAGAIIGCSIYSKLNYCYGAGATGKGTSFNTIIPDNFFYNTDPKDGDIFRVMTGFTGKVESLTSGGTTYYPFTTTYDPSATPAYGIIPQRAVWTKDAWKDGGSDPRFPEIDIEAYEGK